MSNPIVSILITVYNREKYIAHCIESVLASTFQDWELIIVDDQSQDNSVSIAKTYAAKEKRIQIYVNEKNLGDYLNRNKAASYAKGKYIKYLDADDLIYSHGLEIMVRAMEQFPEAALGVSQKVVEDKKPFPFLMSPKETFHREFLQRGVLGLGPTGTIIRRDIFGILGGFTGTNYIGDTELWYKLALNYHVVKIVDGLIFWREHEEQQTVMEHSDMTVIGLRYLNQKKGLLNAKGLLSDSDYKIARKNIKNRFSRKLLGLIKKGHFLKANQIRMQCKISWLEVFRCVI